MDELESAPWRDLAFTGDSHGCKRPDDRSGLSGDARHQINGAHRGRWREQLLN
jgi:hypothetical protein